MMKYAGRAHSWLYRRTGGRAGGSRRVGAGFKKPVPTLLLEHRGRKSGKTFASPLVYITDGDDVIIVASMGGRAPTRSGTTTCWPIPMCTSKWVATGAQCVQ